MNATIHELQANKSAGLPASAQMNIQRDVAVMPGFNSSGSWELAQRIGKAFASSDLVPAQYRGNLPNCIVALEMANRMGASPLMVMQNLYIVHGNPGWSAKFLIACFNQSGKFSAIRYEFVGTPGKAGYGCRAWAVEKATGDKLQGALITKEMADAEGWTKKQGSKWLTMPEQMMMYRAASFFVRAYAPEISMGLRTTDEIEDGIVDVTPNSVTNISEMQETQAATHSEPAEVKLSADFVLQKMLKAKTADVLDQEAADIELVADEAKRKELKQKYEALRGELV